jgi:hypothetical protein
MRKVLISLLLASAAATPALAERPNWSDRESAQEAHQQAREDRSAAREERSSESNHQSQNYSRPERSEQRSVEPRQQQSFEPQQSFQPQQSVERRLPSNFTGNSGPVERSVEAYRARQQTFQAEREQRIDQRAERLQQLRGNRELRQSTRPLPNVMRTRVPVVSDVPRPGTQPPLRVEQNHAPIQWSSNWRHNSKYDWQSWRHKHRSLFHLGFYYDPFGWDYYPCQIGWRLWPSYYSSNFWINDPWYYRLPYAPPGTRWIRYYDDAILVDMWSGQVVDVIYNFFW